MTGDLPFTAEPDTMVEALRRVAPRAAAAFRLLWAAGATVAILAWSIKGPVPPLAMLVAALMALWSVVVFVTVWRRGGTPPWTVPADAGLFAVLLLTEGWLVPPHLVGDGTNWIMTGATVAILVASWALPPDSVPALLSRIPWRGLIATGGLTIAYLVGLRLAGKDVGQNQLITALVLVAQGGLAVAVLAIVARASVRADTAVARQASTERAATLEIQREQAREEQDRMLHDQVGTSLWLLGRGLLPPDKARARANEAVGSLQELAAGRPVTPRWGTLVQRMSAVVEELSHVGLNVELAFEPLPARQRLGSGGSPLGWLPWVVIDAVSAATREALANVVAHAVTTEATVLVRTGPSRLAVIVSDHGVGFAVDGIDPDRNGVRGSIVARMEDVGGTATVASVPMHESPDGHGTTWTLAWEGAEVSRRRSATLARAALPEYGRGFLRMFAVIAAVFHLIGLITLLTTSGDYRYPAVALGIWIIMAAAGAVLYGGVDRAWYTTVLARLTGAVIIAAGVVLALDCRPGAALGFANWALGDAGWFLALLGAYLPVRQTAAALAAAASCNALPVLVVDRPDADAMVKLVGLLVGIGTLQIGAAVGFGLMRNAATATAASRSAADEVVAARIAEAEARDHRARVYRGIDTAITGVLSEIADGVADPHDDDVRQRCLRGRDVLRRYTMLRRAGAADLVPLAAAAERAGLHLRFPILHRLDRLGTHRRHQMVALMMTALAFARPGEAVVTVQDNADLSTSGDSPRVNHSSAPLSLTFRFDLAVGAGRKLRQKISEHGRVNGLHVELDLSDDEGNAGDENATLAWLAVVCRHDDGGNRR